MTESGKWMQSLSVKLTSDVHISGNHGYELWKIHQHKTNSVFFQSGFVYSTREDAEQAGEDAAYAAWLFRNL